MKTFNVKLTRTVSDWHCNECKEGIPSSSFCLTNAEYKYIKYCIACANKTIKKRMEMCDELVSRAKNVAKHNKKELRELERRIKKDVALIADQNTVANIKYGNREVK